jgi:hypothetical protein
LLITIDIVIVFVIWGCLCPPFISKGHELQEKSLSRLYL